MMSDDGGREGGKLSDGDSAWYGGGSAVLAGILHGAKPKVVQDFFLLLSEQSS